MSIQSVKLKKIGCGCGTQVQAQAQVQVLPQPGTVPVCVVVEKVFDSCLQRECFLDLSIPLPIGGIPPFTFVSMTFLNGVIVPGSIVITPIPNTQTARIQFTVQIPYTLVLRDSTGALFTIPGTLPNINKDIILYFPTTPSEFDFNLRVETRTTVLGVPTFTATTIVLSVGTFIITKVTGIVQLQIPEFGFCPTPGPCEEFIPDNPCVDFETAPVPDFFPPQQTPFR